MENKYILIGKIVNTFGLKGELKISTESDFIFERFKKNNKIYFKLRNEYYVHTITSFRMLKNNPVITIDNLFDINEVTNFIGFDIYAAREDNPILNNDEYFVDDLVNLKVYYDNDEYVGKVKDVILMPKPTKDLLEIITMDKKTILIPIAKDFIKSISDKIIINKIDVVDENDEI